MIDWGLMALCIVMMLLGFFELYRTFRFYKWDKKNKEMPTAPYVIYFGIFFSGVLIVVSAMFIMGNTSLTLPKIFYIILGIILVVVAILMYRRGHQMSKKLGKDDSNIAVVQTYLISTVILITGLINFLR